MNGQASPVDFGVAVKGAAAPQLTFKVVNNGGRALDLGEIKVPTGFALVEGPGASLAAGASDTFVVRMDTAVVGAPGGFISIASSDADEHPFTFAVTGTVIARTPPASTGPVTLRASADAHVQDGSHAGKNFGDAAQLHLKKDRTGMNREVYVRFDLASLPEVGAAKLRMFGKIHSQTERPVVGVYAAASNANWSESGLTWNNRPAADGHGTRHRHRRRGHRQVVRVRRHELPPCPASGGRRDRDAGLAVADDHDAVPAVQQRRGGVEPPRAGGHAARRPYHGVDSPTSVDVKLAAERRGRRLLVYEDVA